MKLLPSPIRYPGGKSRAVNFLKQFVPEYAEYREPFIGGGSLFVYLKQIYPTRKYWISDAYRELIIFWQVLQRDAKKLSAKILHDKLIASLKELFDDMRNNIYAMNCEFDIARAFFIINKCAFSGLMHSTFSQNASVDNFSEACIKRLALYGDILRDVEITNEDYNVALQRASENVFIFLDPPYSLSIKSNNALYGKNGEQHKSFSHEKFATDVTNCKHRFLITYNNSQEFRTLFNNYKQLEWNLRYAMKPSKNAQSDLIQKMGAELLIWNYAAPFCEQGKLL
jgi:DNA adenine methylase